MEKHFIVTYNNKVETNEVKRFDTKDEAVAFCDSTVEGKERYGLSFDYDDRAGMFYMAVIDDRTVTDTSYDEQYKTDVYFED